MITQRASIGYIGLWAPLYRIIFMMIDFYLQQKLVFEDIVDYNGREVIIIEDS